MGKSSLSVARCQLVLVSLCLFALATPPLWAADLTINTALVKLGGTANQTQVETVTAGETLAAGQAVYFDAELDKVFKAENDAVANTVAKAKLFGVVLVGGATDGAVQVVTGGPMVIGATMTAGMNYVASANVGMVAPVTDLVSGKQISSLGHAVTTTVFWVEIKNYGLAVP